MSKSLVAARRQTCSENDILGFRTSIFTNFLTMSALIFDRKMRPQKCDMYELLLPFLVFYNSTLCCKPREFMWTCCFCSVKISRLFVLEKLPLVFLWKLKVMKNTFFADYFRISKYCKGTKLLPSFLVHKKVRFG